MKTLLPYTYDNVTIVQRKLDATRLPQRHKLQQRFDRLALSLFKVTSRHKKWTDREILAAARAAVPEEQWKLFDEQAQAVQARAAAARQHWEIWLDCAADVLIPQPGDDFVTFYTTSEHDYRSQGWGSRKYAESAAVAAAQTIKMHFPHLTFRCLATFVKYSEPVRRQSNPTSHGYYEYQVQCQTDPRAASLLTRCKVNQQNHVHALQRQGANPRVVLYYLSRSVVEECWKTRQQAVLPEIEIIKGERTV